MSYLNQSSIPANENGAEAMNDQDSKIIEYLDFINYQLREPVTSIFASLPLLAENINNLEVEKANQNLQSLYEKTYMMLKNVNNISLSGKIFGNREISKSVIDFSSLIESIFSGAEMVLPSYVHVSCEVEGMGVIYGNASFLSHGLFNLILNSMDYRKEDNVKIIANLKCENDKCVFTYRDNSIGIKPTVIKDVFTPYFSCDPYDDGEKTSKMGLGLYLAKSAIEHAGGTLLLQSEFSKGVNIVVSIPQYQPKEETVVKSKPGDFVMNRYSEMFVQLCEYCSLPDIK